MVRLSVIIPTYNRVERLKRVLSALEAQTFPVEQFEVVVVSDGSSDGAYEYLCGCRFPFHLVPLQQSNQGAAAARNLGLQHAKGDRVLFLDDDVIPTPQLIVEHMCLLDEKDPLTISLGPMLSPVDYRLSPWVNWEQFVLYKQYDAMAHGVWAPTARQFYTGNSCMNRRVIIEAGGFDPTFKRAEDVELAYRLADRGATFAFNPRAVGYHYAERSFSSWLAIPYAYGSNDVIFHHHKGQTWILPTILEEFKLRHIFIQLLVRLCLDHIYLSRIVIELLKQIALINSRVRLTTLSNMAFSGIFNLRYYQGVADQLGGREKFFSRQSDQPSESKW